jgi:hypothetical protein
MTTSPLIKLLRELTIKAANSASSAGLPRRWRATQKSCICKIFRQTVSQIGVENSGGDGVDGNAEIGGFARQTFSKTDHAAFEVA